MKTEYITSSDIKNLSDMLHNINTRIIDGHILAFMILIVYYCGFKKSEIINLKIRDIFNTDNSVKSYFEYNNKNIVLSEMSCLIFENLLKYMKENRYNLMKTSPIFQTKKRQQYKSRGLTIYLEKCSSEIGQKICLEKIRQSGICFYYNELREEQCVAEEILDKVTDRARCTKREVVYIITDSIPRNGNSKMKDK